MVLESTTTKQELLADGATTRFEFDFRVWRNQIQVVLTRPNGTTSDITTDSTIELSNPGTATEGFDGGVIVYPTTESGLPPLPVGNKITVIRNMDFLQDKGVVNNTRFDSRVTEGEWDKATAERQQLLEAFSRTVQVPVGSDIDPNDIIQDIQDIYENVQNEAKHVDDQVKVVEDLRDQAEDLLGQTQDAADEAKNAVANLHPATTEHMGIGYVATPEEVIDGVSDPNREPAGPTFITTEELENKIRIYAHADVEQYGTVRVATVDEIQNRTGDGVITPENLGSSQTIHTVYFYGSQPWRPPQNGTILWGFVLNGGYSGRAGISRDCENDYRGAGGNGGNWLVFNSLAVSSTVTYNIIVGNGGGAVYNCGQASNPGGQSSFHGVYTPALIGANQSTGGATDIRSGYPGSTMPTLPSVIAQSPTFTMGSGGTGRSGDSDHPGGGGGGGGFYISGTAYTPLAYPGGYANEDVTNFGDGGLGFGAGGGGGSSRVSGGSRWGYGGAGAAGVVIIVWQRGGI